MLERKLFDEMDGNKQVEYINNQLTLGLSLTKVCKNINIGRSTIRDRFAKINYYYSSEKNKYIINEHKNNISDGTNDTNELTENCLKPVIGSKPKNTDSLKTVEKITGDKSEEENLYNNIEEHVSTEQLKNSYKSVVPANITEDVMFMLKWFKSYQEKENKVNELLEWVEEQKEIRDIIDVPEIKMNSEWLNGEIKTRSFTLYTKVLDEFIIFTKKQPFSQQDLLSMAMVEYMKRYK